jgi:hypothetical protein
MHFRAFSFIFISAVLLAQYLHEGLGHEVRFLRGSVIPLAVFNCNKQETDETWMPPGIMD